jgi:hypothetical protein
MQSQRGNRELWLSFIAIICISIIYIFAVTWLNDIPPASEFFGHSFGIIGFLLMLMTETLYSLRKRSRKAQWGRMSNWLDLHIFTGLVGPYLVLLHTSWKFNGLAGLVTLLMIIVVVSGFIGRYLYTTLPRTIEGVELETSALETAIATTNAELHLWQISHDDEKQRQFDLHLISQPDTTHDQLALVLGRSFLNLSDRLKWWLEIRSLKPENRAQAKKLVHLLKKRHQLHRQVASLAMARRLLALWHTVHIPLGMALFTAAFIHICAAIYYATLLK